MLAHTPGPRRASVSRRSSAPDSSSTPPVDRDLLDPAGERERRLIREIHGRADVHADVHALLNRDRVGDGPRDLPFGHLRAVDAQRDDGALAEFPGPALV